VSQSLEELIELCRKLPPMTAAERREQRISWAYGQCALSGSKATREQVAAALDAMDAELKPCTASRIPEPGEVEVCKLHHNHSGDHDWGPW